MAVELSIAIYRDSVMTGSLSPRRAAIVSFNIVESSDAAKLAGEPKTKVEYPFDTLNVGQSFLVPFASGVVEGTLRMVVSRRNRRDKPKRYSVIKHEAHSCYEVARIA